MVLSRINAVLGTRQEVLGLDGSASVTVSVFSGGPRGDLYLRIGVQVPERLTSPERALYGQLRALGRQPPSPQEQQQ